METTSETSISKDQIRKNLLWLGILSIIIMFAGVTSAYIVRADAGNWLQFEMPRAFYISTAIILMSSVTMNWAVQSVKKGGESNLKTAILITFLLGIIFGVSQFSGWSSLVQNNIYFTGKNSNASGQFFYFLTALHLLHILSGLICLLVVGIKAFMGKYSENNRSGVELCAIYWHFLDVLWIFLFLFLLFIR